MFGFSVTNEIAEVSDSSWRVLFVAIPSQEMFVDQP